MIPAWCPDPVDPCCDCLYSITRGLVDSAADAVLECLPEPLCESFARHVSIARPVGPGDYVGGWLEGLGPQPSNGKLAPRMVGTIGVRLVESGFPTVGVTADRIALPPFEHLDYVSRHFYGHAEAATRALLNALKPACAGGCDSLTFVSSRPIAPAGDSMAWEWAFSVKLAW